MLEKLREFFSEFEAEVIEFNPRKVKIDRRTRWKCKFGCSYYGKRFSCPPNVPDDYEEFIRSYRRGYAILLKLENYMEDKRRAQKRLVELERSLLPEYPLAFVLFPGGCDICEDCTYPNCKRQEDVRPTLSSVGLTVDQFGIGIGDYRSVAVLLLE